MEISSDIQLLNWQNAFGLQNNLGFCRNNVQQSKERWLTLCKKKQNLHKTAKTEPKHKAKRRKYLAIRK